MPRMLIFLADLFRDEVLQRDFAKNPKATMEKAGLTEYEQSTIMSQDAQGITGLLAQELKHEGVKGVWAAPRMEITETVEPSQGTPGEVIEQFVLHGRHGKASMTASLERNGRVIPVDVTGIINAHTQSNSLVGRLALPADLEPGWYSVRITASDSTTSTLPMAFQVMQKANDRITQ